MSEPPVKMLHFDIEAAPCKGYFWDLKTRYIPLSQVAEFGYVLCFAWRWHHEEEVYLSTRWDHGEKGMIKQAHDLLSEADVVIHYNGSNYDVPRLNTEFLVHRLGPPVPFQQVDMYQTVRKNFRVTSRSMNHMLYLLGLDSKVQHKGMELWTNCMQGVQEDQELMEDYNAQDVVVMNDLYQELLPWMDKHPNLALFMEPSDTPYCPNCLSTDLRFKGYKHTRVLSYRQYHCQSCGFYPRERFTIHTGKNRRKDILT